MSEDLHLVTCDGVIANVGLTYLIARKENCQLGVLAEGGGGQSEKVRAGNRAHLSLW